MNTHIATVHRNLVQRRKWWAPRHRARFCAVGIAVLGVAVGAGLPADAAEPLRLKLVRSQADVADEGAQCIRGELIAVPAFDEEAVGRGVWLADTLEFPSAVKPGERVPEGLHVGIASTEDALGLQIEITDIERILQAHPEGRAERAPVVILVGRRPATAGDGPCDPETERLDDGAALVRRIRDVYEARGDGQPIEILMER